MNSIISLEALFQKFSRKEGLIIDIRENGEYENAHIPGSINIPISTILKAYKSIPRGEDVYVVCKEGVKSLGMAQLLKLKRIKAHAVSPGGIDQWNELGLPINKG